MIDAASGEDPPVSAIAPFCCCSLSMAALGRGPALATRRCRLQHDRLRINAPRACVWRCALSSECRHAMAGYVRHGRPPSHSRTLFLTYAPLPRFVDGPASSGEALSCHRGIARQRLRPHGLRHACAVICLEAGYSFKESGTTWASESRQYEYLCQGQSAGLTSRCLRQPRGLT